MTSYKLRDTSNDYLKPVIFKPTPPSLPVIPPPPASAPVLPPQTPTVTPVPDSVETTSVNNNKKFPKVLVGSLGLLVIGAIIIISSLSDGRNSKNLQAENSATTSMRADSTNQRAEAPTVAAEEQISAPVAATDESATASDETSTESTNVPDSKESIAAPLLTQGMKWNIKTVDFKDPRSSYDNVQYIVNHADETSYGFQKMVVARPNSLVDLSYDKSLNLIGGKTGQYSPALHYYDFPLWVGKTWDIKSTVTNNKFKDLQTASGVVKGWENISTPFGEVKALKVVVTFLSYKEGVEVSRGLDISWYYPDIGRSVLSDEYYWDTATSAWVKGREHQVFNYSKP